MSLIKSVSGIRGTIGGPAGQNLTPADIVAFVSAYGHQLLQAHTRPHVVIGRDGRISGDMVKSLVISTLSGLGIEVTDLDLSTTPSVEMYVTHVKAQGGIIITASHNPAEWNALKFLNEQGEFISQETGAALIDMAEHHLSSIRYAGVYELGSVCSKTDSIEHHVQAIFAHPLIDANVIRQKNLHVVVDCINSTGAISIPVLLDALGVRYTLINDEVNGQFAHNPEPLPAHLAELCDKVRTVHADMGISVDPDVDRLALVDENGNWFGEEYTLVCVADYVLQHRKGPVVTNLSSSFALRDLATEYGVECHYAPVGEVHVVKKMKASGAVIGGEGNGGVIDPALHYGRDALIGIAYVLMQLATSSTSLSQLRKKYVRYEMVKDKVSFDPSQSPQLILERVSQSFRDYPQDTQDGLKILLDDSWVQLRKSNTEPILRIYAEAKDEATARMLTEQVKAVIG